MATAPETDGRRTAAAARRRTREQQILAATRGLFDERGVAEARIDHIADAVGINRAIVYRHFTGKEEMFALTLVGYLDELSDALTAAATDEDPRDRLAALTGAFVDYGLAYPAFVDCAQALMRRSGPELFDEISESAIYRLGRAISSCLAVLSATLEAGVESGEFTVDDPELLANALYASGLGALQLARVGILVKEAAPGVPKVAKVSPEQVKDYLVASALALATVPLTLSWARRPLELGEMALRSGQEAQLKGPSRPTQRKGQRSRMAVTPWPPAAQTEITPRPEPCCSRSLARVIRIRPPVAAKG